MRAPKTHHLKTQHHFFEMVRIGIKPFELRQDDRDFWSGDVLVLQEIDQTGQATGRELVREVTCIVADGPWLTPGYVAMGLREIFLPPDKLWGDK